MRGPSKSWKSGSRIIGLIQIEQPLGLCQLEELRFVWDKYYHRWGSRWIEADEFDLEQLLEGCLCTVLGGEIFRFVEKEAQVDAPWDVEIEVGLFVGQGKQKFPLPNPGIARVEQR